jgi:hypothetical protein
METNSQKISAGGCMDVYPYSKIFEDSDVRHQRIRLVYDIKSLEAEFLNLSKIDKHTFEHENHIKNKITEIIILYKKYYSCIDPNQEWDDHLLKHYEQLMIDNDTKAEWFTKIFALRQQWWVSDDAEILSQITIKIISLYHYYLKKYLVLALSSEYMMEPVTLQPLLQTSSVLQFISELGRIAQSTPTRRKVILDIAHASKKAIDKLNQSVSDTRFIQYTHLIFFYKLNPGYLQNDGICVVDLKKVQVILTAIYEFIEQVHQAIMNEVINHNNRLNYVDFLFHGDDLPYGLTIPQDKDNKAHIHSLVKMYLQEEQNAFDRSNIDCASIFKAYRYWFKPACFIDAMMCLSSVKLLWSLSTEDCISLYGYFNNKDTRYLMLTMAGLRYNDIEGLSLLAQERRNLIYIYDKMSIYMSEVLIILENRGLFVEPYNWLSPIQKLNPRKRIKKAIERAVKLYQYPDNHVNEKLESLFAYFS